MSGVLEEQPSAAGAVVGASGGCPVPLVPRHDQHLRSAMDVHSCRWDGLEVTDINGRTCARFRRLCDGSWIAWSWFDRGDPADVYNGRLFMDWRGVLAYLLGIVTTDPVSWYMVKGTTPKADDKISMYYSVPLQRRLRVGELAALLQTDGAQIRAEVEDWLVQPDEQGAPA